MSTCVLFGCVKNEEFSGKANIILAKPNVDIQLNSTYFAIGTSPSTSENKDTTLVTTGVVLTGIAAANQDISVKLEIDSIFVRGLIAQANDESVPDANKSAQVLAYKGTALMPADCFDISSLNIVIPKNERSAPVKVVFRKNNLARLSGKTKFVLPFRIITASEVINPNRNLCIFSIRLIKPKPIINSVAYENVALNKIVTVSGMNSSSEGGALAVDGNKIDNASRWVTNSTSAHFIEINLGSPITVSGFATWHGVDSYNNPQTRFSFQIWANNQWVTVESETANTDPQYASIVTPVVTDKVRYNVPAYTNNQVRMFEIEVYRKR